MLYKISNIKEKIEDFYYEAEDFIRHFFSNRKEDITDFFNYLYSQFFQTGYICKKGHYFLSRKSYSKNFYNFTLNKFKALFILERFQNSFIRDMENKHWKDYKFIKTIRLNKDRYDY